MNDDVRVRSAKSVDATGDRLEVVGVDARAVATQVIQIEAIRDRTDQCFVYEPVRPPALAAESHTSVSIRAEGRRPQPAARHRFEHELRDDSRIQFVVRHGHAAFGDRVGVPASV